MTTKNTPSVVSPCIGMCQLSDEEFCTGCYRTMPEISGWLNKPESEKIAIVARCDERKLEFLST